MNERVHAAALWRFARRELKRYWVAVAGGLASLLGALAIDLLMPWPLKLVVDQVLLTRPLDAHTAWLQPLFMHGATVSLLLLAAAIAVLAILSGLFSYLQTFLSARIGYDIAHAIRRELFARLSRQPLAFHAKARSGDILTRVSSETMIIRDAFADWATKAAGDVLLIAGVLTVMLVMNWILGLMVCASLPLLYVALRKLNARIHSSARAQRRTDAEVASRLNEALGSIALIQAFGREGYELDRFGHESGLGRDAGVRNARAAALVSRTVGLIAALATSATVVVGGSLAARGALTPGDLLVFLSYVAALFKPIRDLGKLWSKFARSRVSAERLGEFLLLEPDIHDLPGALDGGQPAGDLIFDRVTFAYTDGHPVLNEASLRIRAGEHVAIIGPSGAGKSTILRLMLRFWEARGGRVLIDGRDIRSLTLESLRREVGVVLQDAVFADATVAANIRYGKLDATDGEIETAARLAGAHDFIVSLPRGYQTAVGERGALLSGGQRQRICLARTLIRDPAILVLDEPTSAVDPVSAALIEQAIVRSRRGRTTLVIGHQFAQLQRFDRVLEVAEGRITDVTKARRPVSISLAPIVKVSP